MMEANHVIRELLARKQSIVFLFSIDNYHATLITLSDASHTGLHEVYGKTELNCGLKVKCVEANHYHPII